MMNKETDEQGRFIFTGLDGGKYRITAERQATSAGYGARKYSGGSTFSRSRRRSDRQIHRLQALPQDDHPKCSTRMASR
jgi:hypothetical protein